jgi:hypothetical protein
VNVSAFLARTGRSCPTIGATLGITLLGLGLASRHVSGTPAPPAGINAGEDIRYGRDIRPILADRCFRCHGPDSAKRQAGLRLDERDVAIADRPSGPAIVPHAPEKSELWRRITSHDPDEMMPPASSNKKPLSSEERELLKRWIASGAEYEPHWAFVAPRRAEPPDTRERNWSKNPIDAFVLRSLEGKGIAPSPPADRETLLRRIFFDLTGLPPTPDEIDAFLGESGSDANERWIARLLTEEPYRTRCAERLATPWLDAARYADTCGIHMDAGRQMWAWRDWVLAALRDNMPFDQFVIEQIAGDLLPGATEAQKIASGFNRNHVTTDEGGAIAEEYLVEYAVERASTTGAVFLGLTIGCARCHDHKFDPVSQTEFYQFYSFFNSLEEPGLYSQLPDPIRAFEPFMKVPTPEQKDHLAAFDAEIEAAHKQLEILTPEEEKDRADFVANSLTRFGVSWAATKVTAAKSEGGATLTANDDGSILVSGENPPKDAYVITLRTDAKDLRLVALEALTDPSLPHGRVGRAPNGNAVLSGVSVDAVSVADPTQRRTVKLGWAWADHEQSNGDFRVVNALDGDEKRVWALNGHNLKDGRVALFLADEPFGFAGGTDIQIRLSHRSVYDQHHLGRVRLSVGTLADASIDNLPAAVSGWYLTGPFPVNDREKASEFVFGPEQETKLDLTKNFGNGNQVWRFDENLLDDRPNPLAEGLNISYVARNIFAPTPRKVDISLGSDDGFKLYLNGKEIVAKNVERGLAPDQDKATLDLSAGRNFLVMKIVNTGGPSGFYHRAIRRDAELTGALVAALLPESARSAELKAKIDQTWKITYSAGYRARRDSLAKLERDKADLDMKVARTMIMKELDKPRETFVLTRGQYDKPDKSRPVTRGVPAALGKLPAGAPADRLGLAQWLVSPENPLFARVIVNRYWEMLFGSGIVRTSEDFGLQSEWPSHPQLLDWLAVEFRESGWNLRHMLTLMMTSATYCQSSRVRPEVREIDPDNRLLAFYPRRRLSAEQVRDQALYVSGLLVEKLGGPSVKPYQPDGLWQEVSMPQSNTRIFQRGEGDDLWRRTLYTYWKRACPPPALMNFDAPTRESCAVRRATTNTPLQALTLWNDEQYVEAARALAQRTLADSGDDRARMKLMFRRCAGRTPVESEVERLGQTLATFRKRYVQAPQDATKLLSVGLAPRPKNVDEPELAAWTMIANALLSLHETVTQR